VTPGLRVPSRVWQRRASIVGVIVVIAGCRVPAVDQGSRVASAETTRVVVVSGILDPSGDRLLELAAPRRHIRPAQPLDGSGLGRYELEVAYESGRRLQLRFDGLVSDDSGRTRHGFFEVIVPEDEPIGSMTITDTSSGQILATMEGTDILE
jgi:hypothetical protein